MSLGKLLEELSLCVLDIEDFRSWLPIEWYHGSSLSSTSPNVIYLNGDRSSNPWTDGKNTTLAAAPLPHYRHLGTLITPTLIFITALIIRQIATTISLKSMT